MEEPERKLLTRSRSYNAVQEPLQLPKLRVPREPGAGGLRRPRDVAGLALLFAPRLIRWRSGARDIGRAFDG